MAAVDGEGLGKKSAGLKIRKNKHALGYPITQPIPSKVHGLGLFFTECKIGEANSALIIVRIWVLRVNNPVRYSSTGSRHATVLL